MQAGTVAQQTRCMTSGTGSGAPWWAAAASTDLDLDAPHCVICGASLGVDADDVPLPPQGPMCGACARAREFDETLWELDLEESDAGLW
jgi:hypothetical protein